MSEPLQRQTAAADKLEKPLYGIRLQRGVVTYFNDQPLLTRSEAERARDKIAEVTGEEGKVESVYIV